MPFNWFRKKNNRASVPDFWSNYLLKMEEPPDRGLPLEHIPFVVFDTETTGLDTKKDRILSIGAVKVRAWEIVLEETFEVFLQQEYQVASSNAEIHGILPTDLRERLPEVTAIPQLLKYIGNAVLVGHHLPFDVAMVNEALKRMGAGKLKNPMLDTAHLTQRLNLTAPYPEPGGTSLDRICERFNIPAHDRHTAAGDAFSTALLLLKILSRLEDRGIRKLKDLLRR